MILAVDDRTIIDNPSAEQNSAPIPFTTVHERGEHVMLDSVWGQGYDAYLRGADIQSCPWAPGLAAYREWRDGFITAENDEDEFEYYRDRADEPR